MFASLRSLAGLLLVSGLTKNALAQTWTECNPMKSDDCRTNPALSMEYDFNWADPTNATTWDSTGGGVVRYEATGGQFTVAKQKDSPTLTSQWFIHFGRVEVLMKSARGKGIVSSIVIQSDTLDEIDWELIGGNETHVQTNYFGKAVTNPYNRALWHPVDKPMDRFVNYTVDWTKEKIDFYVDDAIVRTLMYDECTHEEKGNIFPQTPAFVRIGVWSGGDLDNNNEYTVEWAGGATDFGQAPFNMEVSHVKVTDYGTPNTKEYEYGDRSGQFTSIIAHPGNSTQKEALLAGPEPKKLSISEKFNRLPENSKIAIWATCGGVGLILILAFIFVCFKKRRQGKREAAAYRQKQEAMDADDLRYQQELKAKGISPDALGGYGAEPKDFGGAVVTAAVPSRLSYDSIRPAAAYHDVSQHSLKSPTSPGFGQNQFNQQYNPRSPSPGGDSQNGYADFYQPQPRANTQGSWHQGDNSPYLNRQDSDASQWAPVRAEPHDYNGTYGRVPSNNNGF